MLQIQSPFQQFFEKSGDPLDDGSIYIGTAGLNPNTNPIALYWDDAGTIPAAQPIKTSAGYIVRNGAPSQLFTSEEDYSMNVVNRRGDNVFSKLNATSQSTLRSELAASTGSGLMGWVSALANAQATTVQEKLRRSTIHVADFGGATDLDKVNNALAAVQNGQTLEFDRVYVCTSKLNQIYGKAGIRLVGVAPKHTNSLPQVSGILFTCTAVDGDFLLDFRDCAGCELFNMDIRYDNPAMLGSLVGFKGSARMRAISCAFGSVPNPPSISALMAAKTLLNLNNAIGITVSGGTFAGAKILVIGGVSSHGNTLLNNCYDNYSDTAIYHPAQAWAIIGGFCENRSDGGGSLIRCDAADEIYGLFVSSVWCGDSSLNAPFTWIQLGKTRGATITGCYINGTGFNLSTAISITGVSNGIFIRGNYLGSHDVGVALNGNVADALPQDFKNSFVGNSAITGLPATYAVGYAGKKEVQQGSTSVIEQVATYGATITMDAQAGDKWLILVGNGTAYQIADLANTSNCQELTIRVKNNFGGAPGAQTWGSTFRFKGAAGTAPTAGTTNMYKFLFTGAIWYEISRNEGVAN
jgi:hypothetical protein